jgi:hypothetical protein
MKISLGKVCAFILFLSWVVLSWLFILGVVGGGQRGSNYLFWLIFSSFAVVISAVSDDKK